MRRLVNRGSAVDGWITSSAKKTELFCYAKGYIGSVVNGYIYDEQGKLVGEGSLENIEEYIRKKNNSFNIAYRRRD